MLSVVGIAVFHIVGDGCF